MMRSLLQNILSNKSNLIFYIGVFLIIVITLRLIVVLLKKLFKKYLRKSESSAISFAVKRFDPSQFYLFDKDYRQSQKLLFKSNLDNISKVKLFFTGKNEFDTYKKDLTFLGLTSKNKPCYISKHERSTHFQVIGRTGSGKSASILRNMIHQDIQNGHGVIIIDAKGSGDFRKEVVGMCLNAGRSEDLNILNLGEPENSHTYSPFYISKGVDPQAVADRFFTAIVPNKEEVTKNYYLKQQSSVLRLMISCLAGLDRPFKAEDLYHWLLDPDWGLNIRSRTSQIKIYDQFERIRHNLGREFSHTLSGLIERVQVFANNKILNTHMPDIKMSEIFQMGQVLYCQLPTGANPLLAKDLARVIFQEIEYETSLREIGNYRNKDKFISVYADEFYEWTYEEIVGAIGKARSGNVSWLVAHQSKSDLERHGTAFWQGIWDNTANKIILEQTDPDLADFVSKSMGTKTIVKETWRSSNEFGIGQDQGEQSNREAELLRFNPNNLKNLARVGQGFLLQGKKFTELNFGLLDPPLADLKITRITK